MNCLNCGNENPSDARFCMSCGQALSQSCANCDTILPLSARFCFNCGLPQKNNDQPQAAVSTGQQPQSLLQRFIPPELIRKVSAARNESERRIVTMLFCDVKGSTAAAGKLDPEEWMEIINGAFEGMIRPVYEFEGVVARLMGDGILAFFGAPVAHEDDPQRAVLAGLGILDGIRAYRVEVERQWGVDIDVRVGINTGMVVVGAVGSDLRLEYTAIGDAINLAARMEQTAEPGSVQLAQDTYRLVAPLFEFEDLGGIQVKGKDEPVHAYRVLGRKAQPGRLRGIAGLESPLTGRDREVRALRDSLQALGRGTGSLLFIIGEAGLGKSRLIAESRRSVDGLLPGLEWFETASLSYETSQPYGLIQRLFRRLYRITSAEAPTVLRHLLTIDIAATFDEEDDVPGEAARVTLEVLARMLTGESGQDAAQLEGESFQTRLQQAMRDYWGHRAEKGPIVLVFDDLHWSDVASIELLGTLTSLVYEYPILFLFALRPDRQTPAWTMYERSSAEFGERLVEIELNPLSVIESGELARGLFREIDWPPLLQRRVLEKAGGNPFFVEELVRALLESAVITQDDYGRWVVDRIAADVDLPDTLQGLLLARIDRLEEGTRRTLQLASVIGRSFYYQVLFALAEVTSNLESHLIDLLAADLIREAARAPELEYMFTHALTQQAAYSSILLKRRRDFHQRAGEVIERLFPQRLDELSPVLAQHFEQAQDWPRAARYFSRAGDMAFALYAKMEAEDHYRRALEITLQLEKADTDSVNHLFTRLGRTLELMARYGEALALYEKMASWGTENNEPAFTLTSLLSRATILTTANAYNDPVAAMELLERAKGLSAESGDLAVEARILWNLMLLTSLNADAFPERLSYVEQALAAARQAGLPEQEALILFDSWYEYGLIGEWRRAEEHLLQAIDLFRELDNKPLLAETYARLKYVNWFLGEYDRAIAFAAEGYRIAKLSNNIEAQSISLSGEGLIHIDRGDLQRGLDVMEEAVRLGHEADVITSLGGTQAELGLVYARLGKPVAEGIALAENAAMWLEQHMAQVAGFAHAPLARLYLLADDRERARLSLVKLGSFSEQYRKTGFVVSIWIQTGLAEIELALLDGRPRQALATADALRSLMESDGVRYLLADVMLAGAKALIRLERGDEAFALLEAAEQRARAIGSRRALWEILVLSARLSEEKGDRTVADARRVEAAQIVNAMAGTLTSVEMSASFRRWTTERTEQLSNLKEVK